MNIPILYIYDPNDDENMLLESSFVEDNNSYYVRDAIILLSNDVTLKVNSAFSYSNNAYSIAIKSNEVHQLTIMGFKKSAESTDPCILWTAENGQMLQLAITI